MTTELDTRALRALFEAATAGKWISNGRRYIDADIHWNDDGSQQYVPEIGAFTYVPDRDWAISAHNTYAALLDRAEQADKYEAALREIVAAITTGVDPTTANGPGPYVFDKDDLVKWVVETAQDALEEPDADPS